jgi:hypothetical protein
MEIVLAAEITIRSSADSPKTQALIRQIANENPVWSEERFANELLLNLGIRGSPRAARRYLPRRRTGPPRGDLRWSTVLACTTPPSRHRRGESYAVRAKPILGRLHHEYSPMAACA